MADISGVYIIHCKSDGKVYVGSSNDVTNRLFTHRGNLRKGKHTNQHLQRAFVKYGESQFEFRLHEPCPVDRLLELEKFWIDSLHTTEPSKGYNLIKDPTRTTHSVESRLRMSLSHKNKTLPTEQKQKIAESLRGRPKSVSHRANISRARIGMQFSEEHRRNISLSHQGPRPERRKVNHG